MKRAVVAFPFLLHQQLIRFIFSKYVGR